MAHTTGTRVGVPAYHPGVILVNYLGTTIDTALCSSSLFFLSIVSVVSFVVPIDSATDTYFLQPPYHHCNYHYYHHHHCRLSRIPRHNGPIHGLHDCGQVVRATRHVERGNFRIRKSDFSHRVPMLCFQCFVFKCFVSMRRIQCFFKCVFNVFFQCFVPVGIHTHWKTFSPPPCPCH